MADQLTVLLVPADMTKPVRHTTIDAGLKSMQAHVGNSDGKSYIEAVRTDRVTGWVDEEGTYTGLPVNWRLSVLLGYPGPLFGDGFIDGPCDAEGDETSIPDSFVAMWARPLLLQGQLISDVTV